MTTIPARPAEISALAAALHAAGSVRVPLDHLWALWTTVALWDQLTHIQAAKGRVAQESVPLDIIATWASEIQ